MIPTLPNGQTLMLEKVMRLVNLIEADVPGKPEVPAGTVFLTATEWGTLMSELRAKLSTAVTPENEAFFQQKQFLIGRVTLRNAGTDDVQAVMLANKMYEEQTGFAWKKEALRVG